MKEIPHIILYPAGSGGEMVSAVIDSTNYRYEHGKFICDDIDRNLLREKKIKNSSDDQDLILYIKNTHYKSIPSHYFQFHKRNTMPFIFIDCSEPKMAAWVQKRSRGIFIGVDWFQTIRTDEQIIEYSCEFAKMAEFNIKLRDILEGKLIHRLKTYINTELEEHLYYRWLEDNLNKYPI